MAYRVFLAKLFAVLAVFFCNPALLHAREPQAADFQGLCRQAQSEVDASGASRIVCADVVALKQLLVYNRFGSFNPHGMIFALRSDVVSTDSANSQTNCDAGQMPPPSTTKLKPGEVRLRDCLRPRPIVLRANVGDLLFVRVTNLLPPAGADPESTDTDEENPSCATSQTGQSPNAGTVSVCPPGPGKGISFDSADWPRTRSVNFVVEGLLPLPVGGTPVHDACLGLDAANPGKDFTCLYKVVQEGTHFMASRAAPAGGEGDGGSVTHGLFGAVLAERPGTRWYRSQVSARVMNDVWAKAEPGKVRHARQGDLRYEAVSGDGRPLLNMAQALDVAPVDGMQRDFGKARVLELVHTDLNAVIWCDGKASDAGRTDPVGCAVKFEDEDRARSEEQGASAPVTSEPTYAAFREFTVFFHDELKSFYRRNFEELGTFKQLSGVRDGFAINYGASGMGAALLANRKGIGPAAACAECLYEEFFLSSWANGDPALLEWYPDDPSNVHHSYLNDPVVFRNFHAGPKETHVFHLHAHQWFAGNDPGRGGYLDSQTVAPGQGFTYNIYHGGRKKGDGKWYTAGSGNRNRTVGDSIFHCHLYPHFAQGMWALWRVHDVFEDGSRKLPDGQARPGLSTELRDTKPDSGGAGFAERDMVRAGSVDPETGEWHDMPGAPDDMRPDSKGRILGAGTPVPGLVPLPGEPLPPLPTYATPKAPAGTDAALRDIKTLPRRGASLGAHRALDSMPERLIRTQATTDPEEDYAAGLDDRPTIDAMPGYPFYVAGLPGHRPPQPPRDMARALAADQQTLTDDLMSGGLGRHVVTSAGRKPPEGVPPPDPSASTETKEHLLSRQVARALALGDMTTEMEHVTIRTLNPVGEPLERAAEAYHYDSAGLSLRNAMGDAITVDPAKPGAYAVPQASLPDGPTSATPGSFFVNGAPPAPGAPFADPCGGALLREGSSVHTDLLTNRTGYVIDPDLQGFRRYEVSAVQLDLVVNGAGWHDPQARIDVLTSTSDAFKDGADTVGRISPQLRDDIEPFFFRAVSGECIEFRHTNELPHVLRLDDFQVRTPTDTIGQHIHLVKFDVTSSDGSGNGWNYEDGTFAPDEILARRCEAQAGGALEFPAGVDPARLQKWGTRAPDQADCDRLHQSKDGFVWRLKRSERPDLFQTTVQRWFADPVLTTDGSGVEQDRTLRTVFSHDHFGPSSIQQHGFYTALLIEPQGTFDKEGKMGSPVSVCDPHQQTACAEAPARDKIALAKPDEAGRWVGSQKRIILDEADKFHPNTREFALAVADFALLYDPRDREDAANVISDAADHAGMARLHCELRKATEGRGPYPDDACGPAEPDGKDRPPALLANQGDTRLLTSDDRKRMEDYLVAYRRQAAAPAAVPQAPGKLARPVAPPPRPESISVDHHDPYMVNYRLAALPLRVGTSRFDGSHDPACDLKAMTWPGRAAQANSEVVGLLLKGKMPECSIRAQRTGDEGDIGLALSSWVSLGKNNWTLGRDPETPILEAYQDERLMFRLIQGAQEVQHVFNIAGRAAPRNVDQRFSQGMRDLAVSEAPARRACFDALRHTYPGEYDKWLDWNAALPPPDPAQIDHTDPAQIERFRRFEKILARCDNPEGLTFGQEIGISEHFEMRGRMRSDLLTTESVLPPKSVQTSTDENNKTSDGKTDKTPTKETEVFAPEEQGAKAASDYLYNFGTVDSLWNGAWGLVRIYQDEKSRQDFLKDFSLPAPQTLVPLSKGITVLAGAPLVDGPTGNEAMVAASTDIAPLNVGCPLPTAKMRLPPQGGDDVVAYHQNVAALIVAVRVADVFPPPTPGSPGLDYGAYRRDPDGLMLALLPLEEFTVKVGGEDKKRAEDINDDSLWHGLTVEQWHNRIRKYYGNRPEPFVLRVNAGDCIKLRYVNLMTTPKARSIGDALMPKITPLNTDPPLLVRDKDGHVTGRRETVPTRGELTHSARLGLVIGLPGGELIRNLPLGYGLNRRPLPAADGKPVVSDAFEFYAGRTRLNPPGDANKPLQQRRDEALIPEILRRWTDLAHPACGSLPLHYKPVADGEGDFTLLGRSLKVSDCKPEGEAAELLRVLAAEVQQDYMHYIPYAYGPVPVRATGDVVTQTTRGLFGVIDVLPQDWRIPDQPPMVEPASAAKLTELFDKGAKASGAASPLPPITWRKAASPSGFGARNRFRDVSLAPFATANEPTRNISEFVIFFQDGLNHYDSMSDIRWNSGAGGAKLTPDCAICDDSYDWGEQGVSYRTRPFASQLRYRDIGGVVRRIEASDNFNRLVFPNDFLNRDGSLKPDGKESYKDGVDRKPLELRACKGDQVVIRVVHPGGRARQHSFVMNGLGYDDLFPGFGFPNAALLAPGKTVSAWLHPSGNGVPDGKPYLWHDGPSFLMAGGIWGHLTFAAETDEGCK